MKLQFDHDIRVVSPDNLRAMCAYVSGHCHTYKVEKITKHFAWVSYSNPDEYGNPNPITALLPVIPYCEESVAVVLTINDIKNETDSEDWQYFDMLINAEFTMFRNPDDNKWYAYQTDKNIPSREWKKLSSTGITVVDCAAETAVFKREPIRKDTTRDAGCYRVVKE